MEGTTIVRAAAGRTPAGIRPEWQPRRLSSVLPIGTRRVRTALLTLGLVALAGHAGAQDGETPRADPVYKADARTLERVQKGLTREPAAALSTDGLRFFLDVVERQRTWQDYVAGSQGMFAITGIAPPGDRPGGPALGGGAGIDLLGIFRSVGRAMREREARRVRAQIDRELRAIDAARSTAP